jgi:hypothetical protein
VLTRSLSLLIALGVVAITLQATCVSARLVAVGDGGGGSSGPGGTGPGAGGQGGGGSDGCTPPPESFYKRDLVLVAGNSDTFLFMFDAVYDAQLDAYQLLPRCRRDRETQVAGGSGWVWFDVLADGTIEGSSGLRDGSGGGGGQGGGVPAGYVHIPAKAITNDAPFGGEPGTMRFTVSGRACMEDGYFCTRLGGLEIIEPLMVNFPISLFTAVRQAPLTGLELKRADIDLDTNRCSLIDIVQPVAPCPPCSEYGCDIQSSPDPACQGCIDTVCQATPACCPSNPVPDMCNAQFEATCICD